MKNWGCKAKKKNEKQAGNGSVHDGLGALGKKSGQEEEERAGKGW